MSKVGKVHKHHHSHHVHKKHVKKGKHRVKKGSDRSIGEVKAQRVMELVAASKHWASEREARNIIAKYGDSKFERIIMACENISKLADNINLTRDELYEIAKYIETKLPEKIYKGKAYLRKSETGLARTIEFKSRRAFIHLKTHGVSPLGTGCHKKVTRSIMYAAHKPEMVANSVGDKTVKAEGRVLKKLHKAEGIARTYAVSSHRKKDGTKVYSMITRLYNAHTVRSYEWNRSQMQNRNEEAYIARDLMKGLESMHAKKLAHRDLHSGNFMVHREEEGDEVKVSAALIDFGQVLSFRKVKKKVPRVEIARYLVTPESLLKKKHRVDVRKIEALAIGFSLYHLHWGKGPEWGDMLRKVQVKHLSRKKKKKLSKRLFKKMKHVIKKRRKELVTSSRVKRTYAKVILKLLNPNPKRRLSPRAARKMFDKAIKLIESKT